MKHQNIRRLYYRVRHKFFTTNNLVIAVAAFIAISWAWGSVGVLERNYALQREIDDKQRLLTLTELEVQTSRFQQTYYKSDEYKELAVRERLGLVQPGERALVLPPNTPEATAFDEQENKRTVATSTAPTNVEQWMNFLFGGNSRQLGE